MLSQDDGKSYQMYDLSKDVAEANDISGENPELLNTLVEKHGVWESGLVPQQWGWDPRLGYKDPRFGKPRPYHQR